MDSLLLNLPPSGDGDRTLGRGGDRPREPRSTRSEPRLEGSRRRDPLWIGDRDLERALSPRGVLLEIDPVLKPRSVDALDFS